MPRLPIGWLSFLLISSILILLPLLLSPLLPLPLEPTFPRPITATILLTFYLLFSQGALRLLGLGLSAIGFCRRRLLRDVLAGINIHILIALYAVALHTMQGMPPQPDWLVTLAYGSLDQQLEIAVWLLKLIINASAVGVMEEIVFRGWIVTFLLTRWDHREGVLWLSSMIFALAHAEFELNTLLVRIAFGYVFGLLYVWRKNLTAAITVHTLHNFCVWAGLLGGK